MKTRHFLIIVAALSLFIFTNCEKDNTELISVSEEFTLESQTTLEHATADINTKLFNFKRAKKGKGQGGPSPVYAIDVHGSIVSGEITYGQVGRNSPKSTSMGAMYCGSTELDGIGSLMNAVGKSGCGFADTYCSLFYDLKQWDKQQMPERVALHFWFDDFSIAKRNKHVQFTMHGNIRAEDKIDGKYTIIPPAGSTITIDFDSWRLKGDLKENTCSQDFTDFNELQSVTISYVDPNDVSGICANVGTNCQGI